MADASKLARLERQQRSESPAAEFADEHCQPSGAEDLCFVQHDAISGDLLLPCLEARIDEGGQDDAQLPGGEDLCSGLTRQLDAFLFSGDLQGAIRVAATSPEGVLRTASTIQKFKCIPQIPNTAPPLLQYFCRLLDNKVTDADGGKLNTLESVELARLDQFDC